MQASETPSTIEVGHVYRWVEEGVANQQNISQWVFVTSMTSIHTKLGAPPKPNDAPGGITDFNLEECTSITSSSDAFIYVKVIRKMVDKFYILTTHVCTTDRAFLCCKLPTKEDERVIKLLLL